MEIATKKNVKKTGETTSRVTRNSGILFEPY